MPRFIEYFLRSVANKSKAKSIYDIAIACTNDDYSYYTDILRMTSYNVCSRCEPRLIKSILSLAIYGKDDVHQHFCKLAPNWTVSRARDAQLLHWVRSGPCTGSNWSGLGQVVMPPLLLLNYHTNDDNNQTTATLQSFITPPSSIALTNTSYYIDIELLAISCIAHKLHGSTLLGVPDITLSHLVGPDLLSHFNMTDIKLEVPQCTTIKVWSTGTMGMPHPLDQNSFISYRNKVLQGLEQLSLTIQSIVLNYDNRVPSTTTATTCASAFVDGFIIFENMTIFICDELLGGLQWEGQGRASASAMPLTQVDTNTSNSATQERSSASTSTDEVIATTYLWQSVQEEYNKIKSVMQPNDIFLYITDEPAPAPPTSSPPPPSLPRFLSSADPSSNHPDLDPDPASLCPPRTLVVSREYHKGLFGDMLTWIRASVREGGSFLEYKN